MGWSYGHREKGEPVVTELQRQLGMNYGTIVESSVHLTVAYLAVEQTTTGKVYGVVVLLDHHPLEGSDGYYNFGTKWMDETMGPVYYDAPRKVLEALTDPPPSEYAGGWREGCWKAIKARESRPKVRRGSVVVFDNPIRFTSSGEVDTFVYLKGSTFARPGYNPAFTYRITRWRDRSYKVYNTPSEMPQGVLDGMRVYG